MIEGFEDGTTLRANVGCCVVIWDGKVVGIDFGVKVLCADGNLVGISEGENDFFDVGPDVIGLAEEGMNVVAIVGDTECRGAVEDGDTVAFAVGFLLLISWKLRSVENSF